MSTEEEEGPRRRSLRLRYSSKDISARPTGIPVEDPHTPQEEATTCNQQLGPASPCVSCMEHPEGQRLGCQSSSLGDRCEWSMFMAAPGT